MGGGRLAAISWPELGVTFANESSSGCLAILPAQNFKLALLLGVELIEGSSGSSKRGGRKGGRGKRRRREAKYPGLTDLKKHTDTPRKRLERKVLSKRALKSVAASMDSLNAKKFQDKFGYNFNYALHS